jgi:hypothetical protein
MKRVFWTLDVFEEMSLGVLLPSRAGGTRGTSLSEGAIPYNEMVKIDVSLRFRCIYTKLSYHLHLLSSTPAIRDSPGAPNMMEGTRPSAAGSDERPHHPPAWPVNRLPNDTR